MTNSPLSSARDSHRNNSQHVAVATLSPAPVPLAAIISLVIIAYVILIFIGK